MHVSMSGRLRCAPVISGLLALAALMLAGCATAPTPATDAITVAMPNGTPDPRDQHNMAQLRLGVDVLKKQSDPERAIHDYFDPVIADYEARFGNINRQIFCARSATEALIYTSLASSQSVNAEVIGPEWSNAYLLKGYALIDLGDIPAARVALQKAVDHSPENAQYLHELAFTYQLEFKWKQALTLFESAADAAGLTSPDETRQLDYLQALHGQGYVLTEQGQYDEAEALYQKCLAMDPNDQLAKQELTYIDQQRTDRKILRSL